MYPRTRLALAVACLGVAAACTDATRPLPDQAALTEQAAITDERLAAVDAILCDAREQVMVALAGDESIVALRAELDDLRSHLGTSTRKSDARDLDSRIARIRRLIPLDGDPARTADRAAFGLALDRAAELLAD
jgi:hypothetical protein